ncbi:hypothetical protein X975_11673, partial [Stegodyphus mimosarum]
MTEKRISGWFVLSAIFIIAVFGLFFTFTERKTWPEQKTELSATDMKLIPPSSTLWCEAIALYSDHPFVAYQVSRAPRINPKHLSRQKVGLQLKLGTSRSSNSVKLRYFLLPSSVMEIVACSSHPGAHLLVFKGEKDIDSCLESLMNKESDSSSANDSDESSEENDSFDYQDLYSLLSKPLESVRHWKSNRCSSLLIYHVVETSFLGELSLGCSASVALHPMKVNITSSDYYVIAVLNTNGKTTNNVGLQILLDRSRYVVHRSGQAFDMCSLSTACTIGLGFGSSDRALVWIPDEHNAGRSTFTIRSRCKPRLAVFAILSVFLPLMMFLLVAFVVRADREGIRRIYNRGSPSRNQRRRSEQRRFENPLLDDSVGSSCEALPSTSGGSHQIASGADELPPPYHTLYDPPPPYACLKIEKTEEAEKNASSGPASNSMQ